MTKRQINGYTIIAERRLTDLTWVILGHATTHSGHAFVVARVSELTDTSWDQGHYSHALESAIVDFRRLIQSA